MTRYSNGANRERRIMHKFEKDGWWCIRSAGSHGVVDIFAMKPLLDSEGKIVGHLYRYIQSKKTGYLSPKEREKIQQFEKKYGVDVWVM